jgi:N-acetylglucosamine kinase-like BadF-type ATPase
VIVICGAGVAAAGLAPDGRHARLAALGPISGDWGGGNDVGWAGLAAATRSRDGRGGPTTLATLVPAHFGVRTPAALTAAFYTGRIGEDRIGELSPVVFAAAEAGDAVARGIVDRLADEVVAMAGAMIRRLRLGRLDPDVVLGGGVFRTQEAGFHERIRDGVAAVAPRAQVVSLTAPPVAGAALLGLDALGVSGVGGSVRAALSAWDREASISRRG